MDIELEEVRDVDVSQVARDIAERARRFRWKAPSGVRMECYLKDIESARTARDLFKEISYFGIPDWD